MVVLVDFVVFVSADVVTVAIMQRNRHVLRLRTRPCCRRHRVTQPACRVLAHKAISLLPLCDMTGMPCACAQGHIVITIVQHDQHVVRKCTRLYCHYHCATQPACRALAHEALSSSPVWLCDVRGFVLNFVDLLPLLLTSSPSRGAMYEALLSTLSTSLPYLLWSLQLRDAM